jgi:hypothetical protein
VVDLEKKSLQRSNHQVPKCHAGDSGAASIAQRLVLSMFPTDSRRGRLRLSGRASSAADSLESVAGRTKLHVDS